jgi:hypothetical protein
MVGWEMGRSDNSNDSIDMHASQTYFEIWGLLDGISRENLR